MQLFKPVLHLQAFSLLLLICIIFRRPGKVVLQLRSRFSSMQVLHPRQGEVGGEGKQGEDL